MPGTIPLSRGRVIGRYLLYPELAAGGMATIHLGRLVGEVGFTRTVAIKRLHPQYAKDPEFVAMFLDEARVASRIRHPNVVSVLDVVSTKTRSGSGEVFLVMDYVHGEPLSRLRKAATAAGTTTPSAVACALIVQTLHGLHAAHEALAPDGVPLGIVHRDVSPHNVLVGADGVARITDFGIAKAIGRAHTTRDGAVKGKLAYMAPEQLQGDADRRTDVFAAAIVLWETLTGRPLFLGESEPQTMMNVVSQDITSPREVVPEVSEELAAIVLRALERDRERRFQTAEEMAAAIESSCRLASASEISRWVQQFSAAELSSRAAIVRQIEADRGPWLEDEGVAPPHHDPEPSLRPDSLTRPDAVSAPARSRAGLWLGLALLVGAGAGAAVYLRSKPSPASASVVDPGAAPSSTTNASDGARPSATALVTPVASVEVTPASVSAVASTLPVASASVAPVRSAALARAVPGRPVATAAPTAAAPSSPSGCNPNYTLDANGVKRWKPECFGK